ncbi:MAG: DUF924 family protein [Halioglobus sp.]
MRENPPGHPIDRPQHNGPGASDVENINAIHAYWFGELNAAGLADDNRQALWFGASPETDAECRERFGSALAHARGGRLAHWADTDRGLVALVVLLDQFSRNIDRGRPEAFAADAQALTLAQTAIGSGRDRRLPAIHRVFLYLPLEHSENLQIQRECLRLFSVLAAEEPGTAGFLRYAQAHHDVIERFGRFPHRNAILGRASSAQELDYLATHGGF